MVVRRRLDIAGHALVFVTTTTAEWRPLFQNKELALICLSQLAEAADYFSVSIVGYVLMPHHLHALLGFKQIELLSKFMQSFKVLSAKKIKKALSAGFPISSYSEGVWKPRFDDIIIYSEEQLRTKLNYIHNNPVKAGLVSTPVEWPYSSAGEWLGGRSGLIPIDRSFRWTE